MIQIANRTIPETAAFEHPADADHGYRLGIEGFMSVEEACSFLGGVSLNTLDKLFRERRIRKTQISGRRIGVCRRSILDHAARNEMIPEPSR